MVARLHGTHFLFEEFSGDLIGYHSPVTGEEVLGGLGAATAIPVSESVPFKYSRADMGIIYVNGQSLEFVADTALAVRGNTVTAAVVADGANVPTFVDMFEHSTSTGYDNTGSTAAGVMNALLMWFDGLKVNYQWTQEINPIQVPNPFVDTIPPAFASASVADISPTVISVVMNEALFGPLPAASAFVASGKTTTAVGSGGVGIINVMVNTAYENGDIITIIYNKPGVNPIKDGAGNETPSFGPANVTNNVGGIDILAPSFISATVENAAPTIIVLIMSEGLAGTLPAPSAFTASGKGVVSVTLAGVGIINVTVDSAYSGGEVITLSYTKPASNPFQDASGNQTPSFGPESVTNNVGVVNQSAWGAGWGAAWGDGWGDLAA